MRFEDCDARYCGPEDRERRSRTDKDGPLHRPSRFGRVVSPRLGFFYRLGLKLVMKRELRRWIGEDAV